MLYEPVVPPLDPSRQEDFSQDLMRVLVGKDKTLKHGRGYRDNTDMMGNKKEKAWTKQHACNSIFKDGSSAIS